jgi:hypothetical protein
MCLLAAECVIFCKYWSDFCYCGDSGNAICLSPSSIYIYCEDTLFNANARSNKPRRNPKRGTNKSAGGAASLECVIYAGDEEVIKPDAKMKFRPKNYTR